VELEPDLKVLLDKWGFEEVLYKFLESELKRINRNCFGGQLSLPRLQVKPMWLSRGLLGERRSGADYEPRNGDKPAVIGLFSIVLRDEHSARIALAHEMIHHWEMTTEEECHEWSYPKQVDEMIRQRFSNTTKEHVWRIGHSTRFIWKACEAAKSLGISVRDLLFRC
jgi:hypothetical protein